jgi:hypothetical protein
MSRLLDDNAVAAVMTNRFELHFLDMKLERRGDEAPHVVSGPGFVRQNESGNLELTLYGPQSGHPKDGPKIWQPGKIIPDSAYYSLAATDMNGHRWFAEQVSVGLNGRYHPHGVIAKGSIHRLSAIYDHSMSRPTHQRRRAPSGPQRLTLFIPNALKFPENRHTTTRTDDGANERLKTDHNVAAFDECATAFHLRRDANHTRVQCTRVDQAFPEGFEYHVVDGLEFVLAAPAQLRLVIEQTNGSERVSMWGETADDWQSAIPEPVPRIVMHSFEHTWQLFGKYLAYITQDSTTSPHPLCAVWRRVLRSSAGSVETMAVVWSTAVEAIIRATHVKPPKPNVADAEEVRKWAHSALEHLKREGCPAEMFARFEKPLERMSQPQSSDGPYSFAKRGIIDVELVDTWKRLRNRVAHGVADSEFEELLYDCDTVGVLLYQLVFHAVGYAGPYSTFTRRGWGVAQYPPQAPATKSR